MGESVQFWGLTAGQRIREGPSLGWAWRLRAKISGELQDLERGGLGSQGTERCHAFFLSRAKEIGKTHGERK